MWHGRDVRDVAFVPSEPLRLLSVSDDALGRLWNVASREIASADQVFPILDGTRIPGTPHIALAVATTKNTGATLIVDPRAPQPPVSKWRHSSHPTAIAWSSGDWGIVCLREGQVLRLTRDKQDLKSEVVHDFGEGVVPLSAAISADDRFAAVGSADGRVWVWRINALPDPPRILEHDGRVYAVAFDPISPTVLLTAGSEALVRFWNIDTGGKLERKYDLELPDAALCAAFSEDNARSMLAVGFAGGAQLYLRDRDDAFGWKKGAYLAAETGMTRIVVWPDRGLVATGDLGTVVSGEEGWHGRLRFWNSVTGEPVGPTLQNEGAVTLLAPLSAREIVFGTSNGYTRHVPLPVARGGVPETLKLEAEVITCMTLDERGIVRRMDWSEWRDKKEELMKRLSNKPATK
jgi:WD40 repeat protein